MNAEVYELEWRRLKKLRHEALVKCGHWQQDHEHTNQRRGHKSSRKIT